MLRRKPSKIELKPEDRYELDEARSLRSPSPSPSTHLPPPSNPNPNPNPVRNLPTAPLSPTAKARRIGLNAP